MLFPIRASLSQAGRSPFCSPGSSGAQHGVQSGKAPGSPPDACPARPPGRSAPAAPAPPWDSRDGEGKGTSSTRPRCPFSGWILSLAPCGPQGTGAAAAPPPRSGGRAGAGGAEAPHGRSRSHGSAGNRAPASGQPAGGKDPGLPCGDPHPGLAPRANEAPTWALSLRGTSSRPTTADPGAPRAPRPEVVLRPLALRPPLTGCGARPSVPSPPTSPPLGTVGNSGDDSCSSGHCHQVLPIFRAAAQGTGRAILRPISFPPRESAKKQCKNSLP